MADINDLISVPESKTISKEDYVLLNIAKEIKQMQLADLCAFLGDIIPIENDVFQQALTLNDIIKAITDKINTTTAREIAYDGELHMEYGNVNSVLHYLLDIIDKYESGGFESTKVSYIPTEDTPDRVIDRFPTDITVNDILNYILTEYRHSDDSISQEDIVSNTTTWDIEHSKNINTLQDQLDKLYVLAVQESIYGNIYGANSADIELSKTDTDVYTVLDSKILKRLDGIMEIAFCVSIDCNVPGTLYIGVFKDNNAIQEFNIALPVGSNVITPFTITNIEGCQEDPCSIKIKIGYKKDISSNEIPAIIPANGFTVRYSGDRLKLKEG